jgi:hypothetical protein
MPASNDHVAITAQSAQGLDEETWEIKSDIVGCLFDIAQLHRSTVV